MLSFIKIFSIFFTPVLLFLSIKFIDIGFIYIIVFSTIIFTISSFKRKRNLITFIIFFIYWLLTLVWILNLNVDLTNLQKILLFFGWILLSGLCALLYSLPFFIFSIENYEIYFIPFVYAVFEILMTSTRDLSFMWIPPSVSLIKYPLLIQAADIGGSYLLSFFVIFFSILIFKFLKDKKRRKINFLLFLVLFIFIFYYGIFSLKRDFESANTKTIKATLIQPNLEGYMKESYEEFIDYRINMIKSLLETSSNLNADILIFPETSSPVYLSGGNLFRRYLIEFASKNKKFILIGGLRYSKNKDYNSLFLFKPDSSVEYYDKIRLVPFVEHLPYDDRFSFMKKIDYGQGVYTPGENYKVFSSDELKFSGYICFESIFPSLISKFVKNGASFLVNVSEDIWFIKGDGLKQHFYSGILRSVETRRYLIRVSNPGISAVIDWYGNILCTTEKGKKQIAYQDIKTNDRLTFFVYSGNILGKIFIYIFVVLVFIKFSWRYDDSKG